MKSSDGLDKNDLIFEKVIPSDDQIKLLYDLLKKRRHKISLKEDTTFNQHKKFVKSYPYRVWYIIKQEDHALGSFYLSNNNTIGINLNYSEDLNLTSYILGFIKHNFNPLPEIPSVRASLFSINVAPTDKELLNIIQKIGLKMSQISFYMSD